MKLPKLDLNSLCSSGCPRTFDPSQISLPCSQDHRPVLSGRSFSRICEGNEPICLAILLPFSEGTGPVSFFTALAWDLFLLKEASTITCCQITVL